MQMEAYLKASRFRQTIEQHKRAMGGGTAMGPTPAGQQLQVRRGWQGARHTPATHITLNSAEQMQSMMLAATHVLLGALDAVCAAASLV